MRVQHNIAAINANRNLTGNNNSVSKSLEKLSSGYRINRAGDDAAGLAISEKMRAQIKCLDQAETNCNDGISLIQTAEGALQEVHSMLNRMTELAEQSANGTYDNTTDRANLNAELDQLKSEIDRISKSTNFNGINLLDGTLSTKVSNDDITKAGANVSVSGGNLTDTDKFKISISASGVATIAALNASNTGVSSKTTGLSFEAADSNPTTPGKGVYTFKVKVDNNTAVIAKDLEKWEGVSITIDTTGFTATTAVSSKSMEVSSKGTLTLQIGDTSDSFNELKVSVGSMDTKSLGLEGTSVATREKASAAVSTIKTAINKVSSTRGSLGAMQNRLEHTINNLSVTNENMTNAESRIRDTDMAKEMMTYTSKNILAQAAQSMLAQANQQPQAVLSLLQ